MAVYINGVADVISLQDVKDNVKLNELQAPDGSVAMNSQKFSGLGAGTAQNDSMRKGQAEVVLADLVAAVCSETEADNKIAAAAKGLAIFGDGSDGDVDINGGAFSSGPITNNALTRDAFFDDLTLSGGDLNCAGYRLFCKGTLTINASYKVHRNGNNGGNGSAGGAGAGGAALGAGSLGASAAGGNGGSQNGGKNAGGGGGSGGGIVIIAAKTIVNGGTISANGGDGGNGFSGPGGFENGFAGSNKSASIGASGGKGGNTPQPKQGGAGGTATAPTAAQGGYRSLPRAITLKDETAEFNGGAGGGGGAADGTNPNAAGGGGGAGGGCLVLIYNSLTTGTETANGGALGNGSGTGSNGVAGTVGQVIKIVNV